MNLYRVLIDAKDDEGPFYQNYFPYGENEDQAINEVMTLLDLLQYEEIILSDIELITDNEIDQTDWITVTGYNGYLEAIKYGYPENDDNYEDDDN